MCILYYDRTLREAGLFDTLISTVFFPLIRKCICDETNGVSGTATLRNS